MTAQADDSPDPANTNLVFIPSREATDLKLVRVSSPPEWEAYHQIRRHVLFDRRGLSGYDDHHPDDRKPEHIPLVFADGDEFVGAARLDLSVNGNGVVC